PLAVDGKGPPPLDDDVDGQAVQPRRERRFPAKLPELLPCADEDVLRDLVGLVAPEHPAREAVNPPDVRPVEALEGGRVPRGRQGDIVLEPGSRRRFAAQRHHRRRHSPSFDLAEASPEPRRGASTTNDWTGAA